MWRAPCGACRRVGELAIAIETGAARAIGAQAMRLGEALAIETVVASSEPHRMDAAIAIGFVQDLGPRAQFGVR